MANPLFVDVCHAHQNLAHVVSDIFHFQVSFLLFGFLDDFLKISVTKLKDKVLHNLTLSTFRVKNVEHLDYMLASLETVKYFKFTTHVFT
jgi:hypothetical protein